MPQCTGFLTAGVAQLPPSTPGQVAFDGSAETSTSTIAAREVIALGGEIPIFAASARYGIGCTLGMRQSIS